MLYVQKYYKQQNNITLYFDSIQELKFLIDLCIQSYDSPSTQ